MAKASLIDAKELKRFIPLNTLSEHGIESLITHVEVFSAQPGTCLFEQGDSKQVHIYLREGVVRLEADGKEVDRVDAANSASKFPVAHQFPRKYTARALTRIHFFRIDSSLLSAMLAQNSSVDYVVNELEEGSHAEDWMSQLLSSRIFQMIPAANIQKVMMYMEEVAVKAGQTIIRQGDAGDYFYLIHKGCCRVERDMHDGNRPVELAQLGEGHSFGEDALLTGNRRSGTITMLEDGLLLRLSKEHFTELVKAPLSHPFDYTAATKAVDHGSVWLDVREADQFEKGHLPGAINIPFSTMRIQAESLDPDRNYVIYCQDGHISHAAAYLLTERGLNVIALDKGLKAVPEEDLLRSDQHSEPLSTMSEIDIDLQEAQDAVAGDLYRELEQTQALVNKLKLYVRQLKAEKNSLEKKRIAEVGVLREALDLARRERSQVEHEVVILRERLERCSAAPSNETYEQKLAEIQERADRQAAANAEEILRLKTELASLRPTAEQLAREAHHIDEILQAQVKGYEVELSQLRARLRQYEGQNSRNMAEELLGLRKTVEQAELALENEIAERQAAESDTARLSSEVAALREMVARLQGANQ